MASILEKICNDWNDRIKLHSRFWMGDKFESDEEMCESGARDLKLILEDLEHEPLSQWKALEFGCGSGRMLPAASASFQSVTAVDVSNAAIEVAKQTIKEQKNINFYQTSGADLGFIESESIDFCYSFACLNHIPLKILSSVLLELTRVIKKNGIAVFQLYIGEHPLIVEEDTLTIRGYPEKCLRDAFILLGYKVISLKPLKLPFDTHDYERNLKPYFFRLLKMEDSIIAKEELEKCLNPKGERLADENWEGSHFEYRLAATLLKKQSETGEIEGAIKTLEFAISKYKKLDPEVEDLFTKLKILRDFK